MSWGRMGEQRVVVQTLALLPDFFAIEGWSLIAGYPVAVDPVHPLRLGGNAQQWFQASLTTVVRRKLWFVASRFPRDPFAKPTVRRAASHDGW